MKVVLIGSDGQLGSDVLREFNGQEIFPLTHRDIEIGDIDNVKTILSNLKPDVVINTAAYHNVPLCEANPDKSFYVNGIGCLNLAMMASELNYVLVHYSTDYVFDGKKNTPYIEDDSPNPLNVYANSKLTGEYFIKNYCEKYFIIRISGIYGKVPCRAKGGNFISTMVRLASEKPQVRVVNDEILSPTSTSSIALNTQKLIMEDSFGLYHMTSESECSWYEFARIIFDTLKLKIPLYATSVSEFPSSVKRPFYSVLENLNLKTINKNYMPHWKDALIQFLGDNYL